MDLNIIQKFRLIDRNSKELDFDNFLNNTAKYISGLPKGHLGIYESDPEEFLYKLFAALISGQKVFLCNHYWKPEKLEEIQHRFDFNLIQDKKQNADNIEIDLSKTISSEFVIFTSGSSDIEKGVVHTLSNTFYSFLGFQKFYSLDKVCFIQSLPLFHIGGLMSFFRSIYSGGTFSLDKKTGNCISLLPSQISRFEMGFLKKLDLVLLGGEMLTNDIVDLVNKNEIRASMSYGMTETCAQIMGTLLNESLTDYLQPLDGVGVEIVDKTLRVKAKQCFHYYENRNYQNNLEGSFDTKDLFDSKDGRYLFLGRVGNYVKIKGENVNIDKVEKKLKQAANGVTVKVFYFDKLIAFVESENSISKDIMRDRTLKSLTTVEFPHEFIFLESFDQFRNGIKLNFHEFKKYYYGRSRKN